VAETYSSESHLHLELSADRAERLHHDRLATENLRRSSRLRPGLRIGLERRRLRRLRDEAERTRPIAS
jgi:hypothetical protein